MANAATPEMGEYLRRNLIHASSVGANVGAQKALRRLRRMKNAPKWLEEALQGIVKRTDEIPAALAAWRDEVYPERGK